MIIGHRGASGYAPENTLPSFEKALACGANMIEFDVHLSKDGHLVVIHDPSVDRTTNGSGLIREMTLKQIKKLDAGSWFSPEFKDVTIPTFEETVDLIKGRAKFQIEIKNNDLYKGLEEKLVKAIYDSGIREDSIITSFKFSSIKKIKEIDSRIQVALIFGNFGNNPKDPWGDICSIGGEVLNPKWTWVTSEKVQKAHDKGILVCAWIVNDIDKMRYLLTLGVDGITTDFPDKLKSLFP